MKKKIEVLMQDSRLAGNAVFERLNMGYQSAKNTLDKAKTEKAKAKLAYRNAANEQGKKNREILMELRTAFRQAKYMRQYHGAAAELADYRLSAWVESWISQMPEPHESVENKQKKTVKKLKKDTKPVPEPSSVSPTKKRKTSEKPKMESQN